MAEEPEIKRKGPVPRAREVTAEYMYESWNFKGGPFAARQTNLQRDKIENRESTLVAGTGVKGGERGDLKFF